MPISFTCLSFLFQSFLSKPLLVFTFILLLILFHLLFYTCNIFTVVLYSRVKFKLISINTPFFLHGIQCTQSLTIGVKNLSSRVFQHFTLFRYSNPSFLYNRNTIIQLNLFILWNLDHYIIIRCRRVLPIKQLFFCCFAMVFLIRPLIQTFSRRHIVPNLLLPLNLSNPCLLSQNLNSSFAHLSTRHSFCQLCTLSLAKVDFRTCC